MKLMKKIALIFVSITLLSSIIVWAVGQAMIDEASRGELDRGPGRTSGALSKMEGEINKLTSQTREYGEYYEMSSKIENEYGKDEAIDIVNFEEKTKTARAKNMILVDKDFKVLEVFKSENIDPYSAEISELLKQSKGIMDNPKNIKKGFFGGIVTTEKFVYIVSTRAIEDHVRKIKDYLMVITPIDKEYIGFLAKIAGRDVSVVMEKNQDKIIEDYELIELYNRNFYANFKDDVIEFYTPLEPLNDISKVYFRLNDDREVRNNATKNVTLLVVASILLSAIGNFIIYYLIKRKVLNRIVNINSSVNKVTKGSDLNVTIIDNNEEKQDEISVLTTDINEMFTRLKDYSDNLEYIGNHDLLTALMNRHKLMEYINELRARNTEFAVFFIDLDNFKGINDTLGHSVGDSLLYKIAEVLREFASIYDFTVSRIGGDEFVIIREGINNEEEIEGIASEIILKLNRLYSVEKYSYEIKASMGISFYPQHTESSDALFQYSDIAMYKSKADGGNRFKIFEKEMLLPLEIESKLKGAIEKGEFEVYYQPIYDIKTEDIIGAEALIRWNGENGIVFPDQFIPLAKKTGDIVDLDKFVLKEAVKTCREWIDKGKDDFYISINASKLFLKQEGFVEFVIEELDKFNVPYSALRIEITEDEIIDDVEYTINLLNKVRAKGIKVYLDDFGVGYSSFNHIKILPVDVIKIDRSLVANIESDIKTKSIVKTLIMLCHSLNLRVVCEGVEDLTQVNILKDLACDNIQGYYFSRPLPKESFNEFVNSFDK